MLTRLIFKIEHGSDRSFHLLVVCLLIFGGVYSIFLGNKIRFYPDECDYIDLTRYLVSTGRYTLDGEQPTAYRSPGFPVFLSVTAIFGGDILSFRLLNFFALSVVMWCVYKILMEQSTSLAACIGSLMVFGYPLAFYTAGSFYPQTLAAALFLLALFFLTRKRKKNRDYFWGGLSLGILILTVPSTVFILFLLVIWMLNNPYNRDFKGFIISLFPIFLLIGFWTARNYQVFHSFFFVLSNSGEMLLMGNSENTTPNAGPSVDIDQYRFNASTLNEIERNKYFQTQALEYMLSHKTRTIRLYFMKVINYFNFSNNLKTKGVTTSWKEWGLLLTYIPLLLIFVIFLMMRIL